MPEPRYHLAIPVPVTLERSDGRSAVEYALNLSPGGLCLQLRDPLCEGEEVALRFRVPGLGVDVATRALVVWTQRAKPDAHGEFLTETGLRFTQLDESLRTRLYEYVSLPHKEGR